MCQIGQISSRLWTGPLHSSGPTRKDLPAESLKFSKTLAVRARFEDFVSTRRVCYQQAFPRLVLFVRRFPPDEMSHFLQVDDNKAERMAPEISTASIDGDGVIKFFWLTLEVIFFFFIKVPGPTFYFFFSSSSGSHVPSDSPSTGLSVLNRCNPHGTCNVRRTSAATFPERCRSVLEKRAFWHCWIYGSRLACVAPPPPSLLPPSLIPPAPLPPPPLLPPPLLPLAPSSWSQYCQYLQLEKQFEARVAMEARKDFL